MCVSYSVTKKYLVFFVTLVYKRRVPKTSRKDQYFRLVSPTESPNVVRVSFPIAFGDLRQGEVVCFLRVNSRESLRLDVFYSHHLWRRRATPASQWEDEGTMSMPMSPQLEAQISINVQNELWSMFVKDIRVLPGDATRDTIATIL